MKALILIAALALASCAGDAETRATVALSQACNVYATALTDLAALRARNALTPDQVATVDAVRSVVTPICTKPQTDVRSALASVEQAMLRMPKP